MCMTLTCVSLSRPCLCYRGPSMSINVQVVLLPETPSASAGPPATPCQPLAPVTQAPDQALQQVLPDQVLVIISQLEAASSACTHRAEEVLLRTTTHAALAANSPPLLQLL